jgi:hypothetical protein
VAVDTVAGAVRFGTFLSGEEKQWIVNRINRHLRLEMQGPVE